MMAGTWVLAASALLGTLAAALPTEALRDGLNATWPDAARTPLSVRAQISVPLRIMPLGDSITWGSLSSTGNGYRAYLGEYLAGVDVDFVGSLKHGDMTDNDNQGHSGSFLSEIKGYSLLSVAARPNVILLHAGTNDMDLNRDVATAPNRLAAIIDQLFEKCPDASILVAQIIFSTSTAMQARTDAYNAAIASLVSERQKNGRRVMAVDMSRILTTADLADKKHPNDSGYLKMALAWRDAIQRANDAGWIQKPAAIDGFGIGVGIGKGGISGGRLCEGPNWVKQGTVADLVRIWSPQGQVAPGVDGATQQTVVFGDIDAPAGNASWVCHKDRMYFLVAASGDEETCMPVPGPTPVMEWQCENNPFELPPGMMTIDGKAWAGLTKEDLVRGAVNTFEANNKQNGGEPGNTSVSPETIDKIQDLDVTTPGVVFLPVCTIQEARANWKIVFYGGKQSAHYPCN